MFYLIWIGVVETNSLLQIQFIILFKMNTTLL